MNKIYLGSHVSMSSPDFYLGSVRSALEWGENTFMFYTGAPQNSYRLPLERLKIEEGRKLLKENNIDESKIIVHAPYLINLGSKEKIDNYELAMYIINIGHKLFDINEQKNKVLYDSECIYRKKIGDYEVVGMEGRGSSILFNPYTPQAKNTIYCLMSSNNSYSVIFSMYSDSDEIKKKNLGNFMKKYFGGGGHPGAAGASVRKKDMCEMIKNAESETESYYNNKMEGFSIKFTPRYDVTTKDQFAYIFNCLFEYLGIWFDTMV